MQRDLANFSQSLESRSEKIPTLLKNFEQAVFTRQGKKISGNNAVERAAQKSLNDLRAVVETWSDKIDKNRKGEKFIRKNEKYLVVMIFGAVKTGKSTLGNFFAGKKFLNAPFDNHYKKIPKPAFATEERGRNTGDIEKDSHGNMWFQEGVIDTTGAIQYFTLSGLRWVDSPGTGAVGKVGDTKNMTALVEEYLSYTDMCIFLMNSAEPGLQDDMRYMQKLSRAGQEALIVITKSDKTSEDVSADGKTIVSTLIPKPDETRRLQEDDICERIKKAYPEIDTEKFRAISISTALANEAVDGENDQKFRESGLDKLMKILGDKVSDNSIARKQENPRRLLNNFIDGVSDGLKEFDADLNAITAAAQKYKADMERMAKLIVTNVRREVHAQVSARANEWNNQVKRGVKINNDTIGETVSKILQEVLNNEINSHMSRVIEDFQSAELKTVKANISAAALEKKTAKISHTYTESYRVERDPSDIIELIFSLFGSKYYRTEQSTRTEYQTIDLGTSLDEFLDSLMPQVEEYAKSQAANALAELRDKYFIEHEALAKRMRFEMEKLNRELLALKF